MPSSKKIMQKKMLKRCRSWTILASFKKNAENDADFQNENMSPQKMKKMIPSSKKKAQKKMQK